MIPEIIDGDDLDMDINELIYFTSTPFKTLSFAYPGEESLNKDGKMIGSAFIEFRLADGINISTDTTIRFTLSNPPAGVTLGEHTEFDLTIKNMN